MRLGWPFGRRTTGPPSEVPPARDGASAGAGAPAADADPGHRSPAAGGAREAGWRELTPLRPTVAGAPLTAPARPFVRGLAGNDRPDPILEPIGRTADLRPMNTPLIGPGAPAVQAAPASGAVASGACIGS